MIFDGSQEFDGDTATWSLPRRAGSGRLAAGASCNDKNLDDLSVEQQERLSRILDDYFSCLEKGVPIDQEKLLAAHPDLAEPLKPYLESLSFLQDAAAGFRANPGVFEPSENCESRPKTIGDFEIRGGMGVVYEAQQISLNRRVPLKMLPFASLLDSKQIARFRNEAQAAAQLHHPHIVPVYFVGSERGVHYYVCHAVHRWSAA
jgi:hypothetical protein